jgi:hypothetical protein
MSSLQGHSPTLFDKAAILTSLEALKRRDPPMGR